VAGERVDRRRPDAHAPGVARDLQQRQPGRLVEHVVVDADAVEAVILGGFRQRALGGERLVGLKGDADAGV